MRNHEGKRIEPSDQKHQSGWGMQLAVFSILLGVVLASQGCAKKKNDISQVSTNAYVSKSDLAGNFAMVKTFKSGNEELDPVGVVPGMHVDLGVVKFVITENELQVRRVSDMNRPDLREAVVASFPISGHFDIKRDKNDFGEDTNKIIEDTKAPWDQRAYMRIDWGTNKVASTSLANIFSSAIQEQDAKVVTPLKKDGDLLSFDTDVTVTQTEDLGLGNGDPFFQVSGALRTQVKTAFLKVHPSDFKAQEMSNSDFARFGYFRTYENFVSPEKGATISGTKLLTNRFNVCERSAATSGRSCATNKIVYTLNAGFPEEMRQSARDVVVSWNKTFQTALDRTDDIVVLDESIQPEIGDARYNMIAAIDEIVPTNLLGVSQTVNNPNSGETLAARASVYMGTVREEAGQAAEKFDLLISGGDLNLPTANALAETTAGGGKKLIADLRRRSVRLKVGQYKTDPALAKINSAMVSRVASIATGENQDVATSRFDNAMNLMPARFSISDSAWSSKHQGEDLTKKINSLKSIVSVGKQQQLNKMKRLSMAAKGVEEANFIEPAIELFVKKFISSHVGEPQDQLRNELKTQVRKMVFYTTLIHEMGHNFGLRHNFSSSSDLKNYTTQYYELEKQKLKLAEVNPNDPKIAELSLEQQSYDFSSVMDYAGGFYEALGGTGPYDLAAIRFAYNSSISKDGDPISGKIHNYKFCTDDSLGEDLLCSQFDKGSNVSQTTANRIARYDRGYAFRNIRHDQLIFNVDAYFGNMLMRTMLPLRQVADEFLYQLITSSRVQASSAQCDLKWLRDSVDAGEVANICDPVVIKAYQDQGADVSDLSKFVVFLLSSDMTGLRKNPSQYIPNGFADLLYSNYLVTNFFVKVIGTPEPGLYIANQSDAGTTLEALPAIAGGDDARVEAYLQSKGMSQDEAAKQLPQAKANLVDLGPGVGGKNLLSTFITDGIFRQTTAIGVLYDKIGAVIAMGARGLPVQKYQDISMNSNMYIAPQTKNVTTALFSALIGNNANILTETVKTRSGKDVDATVPASLNLDTQFYGLIIGATDLVSDKDHDFADKLRICTEGDTHCNNPFSLDAASFRGLNGQDLYKSVQVISGDSVVLGIVKKGQQLSKDRDQAVLDQPNLEKIAKQILSIETGTANSNPSQREKVLIATLTAASLKVAATLGGILGQGNQASGAPTLWQEVMSLGSMGKNADAAQALQDRDTLTSLIPQINDFVNQALAGDALKLKAVQTALTTVLNDMQTINSLTVRLVAGPTLIQNANNGLAAVESEATFIRQVMHDVGLQ
jgi:hypothetical protein